jgi:Protein of unknown function (DUF1566)
MITRSRSRLQHGERQSPVVGPRHKGVFPRPATVLGSRARRPGPHTGSGQAVTAAWSGTREQAERATVASNYWSSTTNSGNPTNAWNVNFNNGNVNNDNKTNTNYVRAVRGGW